MWFSFYVYSFRFLVFGLMFWRGTKVQISGFNFAAANPSDAKPEKQSKAGRRAEKRRNAIPQAREAREANARE